MARTVSRIAATPVLSSPAIQRTAESSLEIVIGDATIRLHGAVDAQQLRTVMDCVMHRR